MSAELPPCDWSSVCGAGGVHQLVRVRYRNAPPEYVAVCAWHLTPARLKGYVPRPVARSLPGRPGDEASPPGGDRVAGR